MKKVLTLLFIVLFLPVLSAINLDIEKTSENEVMILDIDEPAVFDLTIKNNGASDEFEFYTFFALLEEPNESVLIDSGETKDVQIKLLPTYNLKTGFSTFNIVLRATDETETETQLTTRIINLEEAFEVGSGDLDPDTNSLEVYIHNKVGFDFDFLTAKFSSPFFEFEESFALGPNQRKNFYVELNKEDFNRIMAGFYTLNVELTTKGKTTEVEGIIKFVEKDIVTTIKKESGIIISRKIIEKINEGNTLASSETVIKKNIISRLFTSFSPEPDLIEREGLKVYYSWVREIKPGESLKIIVRTNWLIPFLIIFLIIAIVVLAKKFSKTNMNLRKRVTFVRAKGGEFALKVSLFVHAKKYIEKVQIIDRLPSLVKIYEKFGGETPTKVDEANRRIEWNFEKLEEGEVRVISYLIYSKVGVLGKFALPSATAIFQREGVIKNEESNRAFFVAEQRTKDEED
jgi:hypothetical protein